MWTKDKQFEQSQNPTTDCGPLTDRLYLPKEDLIDHIISLHWEKPISNQLRTVSRILPVLKVAMQSEDSVQFGLRAKRPVPGAVIDL